jgi:voltage-gated potassium channel Kch
MKLSPRNSLKRFAEFWWGDRGLSVLLISLLLLFFLSPFIESHLALILILIFFVLLLVSGTINVVGSVLFRAVAFVVAGAALVFTVLRHVLPSPTITGCWQFSALAYFSLLIVFILRQVYREGPVTGHRVRGAIAVYLLIGITWSLIYQLIVLVIPDAFSFPPSVALHPEERESRAVLTYFSFVTMTTLGYGDIVPVHPVPRMFVIFEALIGQLYPATLLARLVSLTITSRRESDITEEE